MNPRLVLACLLAGLLAVAACGGPVAGVAKRAPSTSVSSTEDRPGNVSGSPSSAADAGKSLANTQPCTLLTKGEAEGALGQAREEPAEQELGTARVCSFENRKGALGVGIRTNVGLAGVVPNGGEVKEISVGDRPAKELLGFTGSCGIYLGVSDTSRVDVVLNTTTSGEDPCPLARRIAELVEPRLP